MKQTSTELNIFPVYETVELIRIIVPSGLLKVKVNKKGRVIIEGSKAAIRVIDDYYSHYSNGDYTGHISFFNNDQFVLPKGCSFRIEEVGTNGKLVRIIIYRELFEGYDNRIFYDTDLSSRDLPFERSYVIKKVDDSYNVL